MLLLGFGEPEMRRRLAGQAGDRVRVGAAPNRLQIGEVGQRLAHGQAPVARQLIDRGPRITREHLGEGDRIAAGWPQAAGQVKVGLGDVRIEVAAGPLADHGRRRFGTGQYPHEVGGQRQMQDLGRPGDRFCPPVESGAAAVVPLISRE